MRNIDKQALRSTSERDWFEDWFKREFHPDKTGPYIKDQLFFAVLAARAPLLDELEAAEKRIAEQRETLLAARSHVMQCARLGDAHANGVLQAIDRATTGKGERAWLNLQTYTTC